MFSLIPKKKFVFDCTLSKEEISCRLIEKFKDDTKTEVLFNKVDGNFSIERRLSHYINSYRSLYVVGAGNISESSVIEYEIDGHAKYSSAVLFIFISIVWGFYFILLLYSKNLTLIPKLIFPIVLLFISAVPVIYRGQLNYELTALHKKVLSALNKSNGSL